MGFLKGIQETYASSDPGPRLVGVAGKAGVEVGAGALVGTSTAGVLALLDAFVREFAVFRSPSVNATVVGGVALLFVRWFECEVIRDGNERSGREGSGATGQDGERGSERNGDGDRPEQGDGGTRASCGGAS